MDSGAPPKSDLRILDPKKTRISLDTYGRLQLEIGIEERYEPVRAVRSLPLTKPDQFISIQDEEGEELGVVVDMAQLDAGSREALAGELELSYLKAKIQQITKVEAKNGIITWDLITNLGPRQIHVRDRSNIRPLYDGRTILTDIHEAKYEIPPVDSLDEHSRKCLETEL